MKMKQILLIFSIFLLIIPFISASSDWPYYLKYYNNNGFQDPTYHGYLDDNLTVSTMGYGNASAMPLPVSADFDGDGRNEMIVASGTTIRILYDDNGTLMTLDERTFRPNSNFLALDADGDGSYEIVTTNTTHVVLLKYENSMINVTDSEEITNQQTAFACKNISGNIGCYMANNTVLYEYNPTAKNISTYDHVMRYTIGTGDRANYGRWITPVIEDLDRDSKYDFIAPADVDADGIEGWTAVSLDDFSNTTVVADSASGNLKYTHNLLVYNLNNAGDSEVCVSIDTYNQQDAVSIRCFKSDGTSYGTGAGSPAGGGFVPWSAGLIMCDITGTSRKELCASGLVATGTYVPYLYCFDVYSDTLTSVLSSAMPRAYGSSIHLMDQITCGDVDGDSDEDIIFPTFMRFSGTNTTKNITITLPNSPSFPVYGIMFPVDSNEDGRLELFGMAGSYSYLVSPPAYDNTPPELYNNLSYGGYGNNYGYDTPICVNSTVTFSAQECGGIASCNYDQDVSTDQERIVSDCGISGNDDNGTWSGANPTFQCYYNSTGVYSVRLYIEDDKNIGDETQFNTQSITMNVINGTPGVTCNIIDGVDPGETGDSETEGDSSEIDNAGTDFFNLLTGNNANSKLLIAIILIGGILTMVYVRTHSNMISMLAGLAMLIGCVAFGLFPIWILLLMLVTALIIIVLVWVVMKNNSSGG